MSLPIHKPAGWSPAQRLAALALALALGLALAWQRLPATDPPAYFAFADDRAWGPLANVSNVLTNLPFLGVAAVLWRGLGGGPRGWQRALQWLAGGVALTALGSAWFHWQPTPATLFWDRLPMVMVFSGLLLLLIADRLDDGLAWSLRWLVPITAMATVALWRWAGTLRPYAALQAGLMAATLLMALATRGGRLSGRRLATVLALYGLAKVSEANDIAVFEATAGHVAGHAIKHLLAALALAGLVLPRWPRLSPGRCLWSAPRS